MTFRPTSGRSTPSSRSTPCFPHLNVFENVAFGLRMQKRPDPNDPKKDAW